MLFLVAITAAVLYCGSLYFWPMRPCRWCAGRGTNRGSSGRRFGKCRRCGGSRSVQRLGSRTIHRLVRGAASRRSR
jgi:hypothetical protein